MNGIDNYFDNDSPIRNPSDDLLGRATFVESLTNTIEEISFGEKFIIGIDGEWGSGKTSCMNLLRCNLLAYDDIEYLYVDAWSHNGDLDSILIDMFGQLEKNISVDGCAPCNARGIKKRKKLEKKLEEVGMFVDGVPSIITDLTNSTAIVKIGGFGVNVLRSLLANSSNFSKVNKRLREKLGRKKVVVVIDDIDRLKPDCVIDILSSLSTVASFEGFIYMLPFDSKILDSCVSESFSKDDYRKYYFDKIIQLCIKIPKVPTSALSKLFRVEYENLLHRFNYNYEDIMREFKVVEYSGVLNLLDTPRDIKRIFISAYYVSSSIGNIVSVFDIVMLELIRIKCPELHGLIYENMDLFVRTDNSRVVKDIDKKKNRLNVIFERYPKFESVLRSLFRYMCEYMKRNIVELDSYEEKSVSNYVNLKYYYTFLFDKDLNRISVIENIFDPSNDVGITCDSIRALSPDDYPVLIDYARGHLDCFTNDDILHAMLDYVCKNNNVKTSSFSYDFVDVTLFLFDEIINKMENKLAVYSNLLEYAKENKYISIIPLLIRQIVLYSEGGKDAVAGIGHILSLDEKESYIKNMAIPTIEWAFNGGLVPIQRGSNNSCALYYHYGAEYLGEAFIKKYTKKKIRTADALIRFFLLFVGTWSTLGEYDYHYGVIDAATFSAIRKYIDVEYAYSILQKSKKYGYLKDVGNIVTDLDFHGNKGDELKETFAVGNEGERLFTELAKQFMYYCNQ